MKHCDSETLIRASLLALDMRQDTAQRRLTKRATEFLGISFSQYIAEFTKVRELTSGEQYIWLNDNSTMQNTLSVWLAHNGRKERLIGWHNERNE